jgi:hypothetical protein
MNKQEENWELMSVLGFPWSDANELTDKNDREFLLGKAKEVKAQMMAQQRMQQQMQAGAPQPEGS